MSKNVGKYLSIPLLALFLGLVGPGAASAGREQTHHSVPMDQATTNVHRYEALTYTDLNGMKMTYYLYVPNHYNPHQKYPLVLVLHGGGESANPKASPAQNSARLLNQYYVQVWISTALQEKWPSFIVIPQLVAPARWVNVPARTGSYTLFTWLFSQKKLSTPLMHQSFQARASLATTSPGPLLL